MHKTLKYENDVFTIIDQTALPIEYKEIKLKNLEDVEDAIKKLKVRGAPAIGVASAFGVIVGMKDDVSKPIARFKSRFEEVCNRLIATRPTAVNLSWAIKRMKKVFIDNSMLKPYKIFDMLKTEAIEICREDEERCRNIGKNGKDLLDDGDTVLTHCNAGALATAGIGTALAVIYAAADEGKKINVFSDETRPLLQGARLTTWELLDHNIPVTLICDNMASSVMSKGMINKVIVGADRIAANGDTANKIGTYSLAISAQYHNVPFYVAAPLSTFDFSLKSGDDIPIEERDPDEVRCLRGLQIAPKDVPVYNPAFDVTPVSLISGFITDHKTILPPYPDDLSPLFSSKSIF